MMRIVVWNCAINRDELHPLFRSAKRIMGSQYVNSGEYSRLATDLDDTLDHRFMLGIGRATAIRIPPSGSP